MLLVDKIAKYPTVKSEKRCEACGNPWFFDLAKETPQLECTTCATRREKSNDVQPLSPEEEKISVEWRKRIEETKQKILNKFKPKDPLG